VVVETLEVARRQERRRPVVVSGCVNGVFLVLASANFILTTLLEAMNKIKL
jgi:hypothetical protein